MLHYIKLAKDELLSVHGQINYCMNCINSGTLAEWEVKEYKQVIKDNLVKSRELKERIEWMESEL